ncbi:MAG: hypothetical protein KQI81_15310 [Deltaproteobacteria bacterium]|nr:hypothetical protein [Deltaproteobacteria bacterium]
MPVTISRNTIQPAIDHRRPVPDGRTIVPAWRWMWLLFFLSGALLCVDAPTAVYGNQAMQWDSPVVRQAQEVCFLYCNLCEIVLSRSNTASFDIPAGAHPTMDRWAWMVPVESESPDKELAPVKVTIIHGLRPSGIACHGYLPCLPKRISRLLYLQKKALLC